MHIAQMQATYEIQRKEQKQLLKTELKMMQEVLMRNLEALLGNSTEENIEMAEIIEETDQIA